MRYRGQTLLGLVISLTLSSFLLLSIITFYQQSQRQNQKMLRHLQLQAELQRAVQLIAKDLRRAGFRALSDSVIAPNFHLFEQDNTDTVFVIAQADNEAAASCVLFFYDLDSNGCIGTKFSTGICADGERNATKEIERELFGYRLHERMLETRLTYKNSVSQSCSQSECRTYLQPPACNGGGWADLLNAKEYEIERLQFDRLADGKGIEVHLAGNLIADKTVGYETSAVIPLLNSEVP